MDIDPNLFRFLINALEKARSPYTPPELSNDIVDGVINRMKRTLSEADNKGRSHD